MPCRRYKSHRSPPQSSKQPTQYAAPNSADSLEGPPHTTMEKGVGRELKTITDSAPPGSETRRFS